MAWCSFNDIGNFLSTSSETGASAQYRVDLDPCDVLVRESIFTKDGDAFVFARKGLERFIARKFGCPEFIHAGNVCCFGNVHGRDLHYSAAPRPNFYSMHGPEASIIIGSNSADVPPGWKGHAALLSNVFTVEDGQIVVAKSGMRMLFPATGEPRKSGGSKKQNARLRFWLEYLCEHIAALQQKYGVLSSQSAYDPRRKHLGKCDLRDFVRPKPGDVLKHLRAKSSVAIKSDQTIRRDIKGFSEFDPKKNKTQVYDKRDGLVAAIWKHIDDPQFVLNPKTLKAITDEMQRLRTPEADSPAVAVAPKAGFEDDADANGRNPTRTVAVEPALNIDKDLRSLE